MSRLSESIIRRVVVPLACAVLFLLILIIPRVWAEDGPAAEGSQGAQNAEQNSSAGDASASTSKSTGKPLNSDRDVKDGGSGSAKSAPSGTSSSEDRGVAESNSNDFSTNFTSFITVGDDTHVVCQFTTSQTPGHALVGAGTSSAIDTTLTGAVKIPKTVTSVESGRSYIVDAYNDYAFAHCAISNTGLLSYKEAGGATITSIGKNVFDSCPNIKTTELRESKLEHIGSYAYTLSGVTDTELADNPRITTVPDYMFYRCSQITRTDLDKSSVQTVGVYAFATCIALTDTGLANNTVLEGDGLGKSSFSACEALKDTGLGKNSKLTTISNSCFANCYKLSYTGLGKRNPSDSDADHNTKITNIGDYAFANCNENLTETGLEDNDFITSLGDGAFSNCDHLTRTGLDNPNCKVEKLGNSAFQQCKNLTATGLADNTSVKKVGEFAFSQSGVLATGLDHNPSITKIEKSTFSGCGNLISSGLAVNTNIEEIGERAFYACTKLGSEGSDFENAGDLVLNASERTKSLTIDDEAFMMTNYKAIYILCDKGNLDIGKKAFDYRGSPRTYIPELYVPASWAEDLPNYPHASYSWGGSASDKSDETRYDTSPARKTDPRLIIMDPIDMMSVSRVSGTADAEFSFMYNRNSKIGLSDREGHDLGTFNVDMGIGISPKTGSQLIKSGDTDLQLGADTIIATVSNSSGDGPLTYPENVVAHTYNTAGIEPHQCPLPAIAYDITFEGCGGTTGAGADTATQRASFGESKLDAPFKREFYDFLNWVEIGGDGRVMPANAPVGDLCVIQDGSVKLEARWRSQAAFGLTVVSKDEDGATKLGEAGYVLSGSESAHPIGLDDLYTDSGENDPVSWPLISGSDGLITTVYWLAPDVDGSRTYYLYGVRAPAGYDLPSKPYVIVVNRDKTITVNGEPVNKDDMKEHVLSMTVTYKKAPSFPHTGWFTTSSGIALVETGGVLSVISVFACAMWLVRRNGAR